MSDPKYSHIGEKDDKVIEECSELIKAICKAKRFGIDDHHPVKLKTNRELILEEMADVEQRIADYRKTICDQLPPTKPDGSEAVRELVDALDKGLAIAGQFEDIYGSENSNSMTKQFYDDVEIMKKVLSKHISK